VQPSTAAMHEPLLLFFSFFFVLRKRKNCLTGSDRVAGYTVACPLPDRA